MLKCMETSCGTSISRYFGVRRTQQARAGIIAGVARGLITVATRPQQGSQTRPKVDREDRKDKEAMEGRTRTTTNTYRTTGINTTSNTTSTWILTSKGKVRAGIATSRLGEGTTLVTLGLAVGATPRERATMARATPEAKDTLPRMAATVQIHITKTVISIARKISPATILHQAITRAMTKARRSNAQVGIMGRHEPCSTSTPASQRHV